MCVRLKKKELKKRETERKPTTLAHTCNTTVKALGRGVSRRRKVKEKKGGNKTEEEEGGMKNMASKFQPVSSLVENIFKNPTNKENSQLFFSGEWIV